MSGSFKVCIIGGGPAGLFAAEILSRSGCTVDLYERKPSPGRKFLMAGRGGLNLTHSEPLENFLKRYGAAEEFLTPVIRNFTPDDLRSWCDGLGEKTFIGSSGRVFPESFKASPLLRAWLVRLAAQGVAFHFNHDWTGWDENNRPVFSAGAKMVFAGADAVLLALGGASWPRLGSDGSWVDILNSKNIFVAPLRPANCGFTVAWSDMFSSRYAGQPVKPLTLSCAGKVVQGEAVITANGIEGGGVYALSATLRDEIERAGRAVLTLDLRPGIGEEELAARLGKPAKGKSFTTFLRSVAGLSPVAAALLMEMPDRKDLSSLPPQALARRIKRYDLVLQKPFGIERAISTAGGIRRDALDENLMLQGLPGVFAAGEMLDWEAPTGGYLLQGTFSTAHAAAKGVLAWLAGRGNLSS